MSDLTPRVWRSGPPPSLGWWPASRSSSRLIIRWWNGRVWSDVATPVFTPEEAGRAAEMPAVWQEGIRWTDRPANWPERSRT